MSTTLTIHLNGEPLPVTCGTTVAALLAQLGLDHRQVAVECNRVLVCKNAFATTELHDADQLEVVTFVGGG